MRRLTLLLMLATVAAFAGTARSQTITYALQQGNPTTMTSGGVADCLRGWRFQVNTANKAVYQLGAYYPDSTTAAKTVTLWTCNAASPTTPGTILAQVTTTPGPGWRWVTLPAGIPLTQNAQYIVVGHTTTVSYYYASFTAPSPWLPGVAPSPPGDITYQDMRYANAAGPSVYPTTVLANYQYGIVDIGYGDAQIQGPSIEVSQVAVDQPGGKPILGSNTVKFRLRNGGNQTYANVPITCEYLVNNGTPVSQVFTSATLVYPNPAVEFSFTQPWIPTLPGPYTLTVRTVPAIGPNANSANATFTVFGVPNIVPQYLDTFQAVDAIDQYQVVNGTRAQVLRSTNGNGGTAGSTHGIVFSGLDTTQAWGQPVGAITIDVSNAQHRAIIDDPSLWATGGALTLPTANYTSTMTLLTNAPGVQRVDVSMMLVAISIPTTVNTFAAYMANMVFEYSTDNVTWTRAWGSGANASGIYRPSTQTAPLLTTFSITGLPGTLTQQLRLRFRTLTRLTEANAAGSQTYIGIDNFQMVVPFTITTLDLPSATGNVPYDYENGVVALTQVSGTGAVTYTANPNPAWMTLNTTTGVITGTPTAADAGTLNITFTGTDSASNTTNRIIPFVVKPAPSAVAITNLGNLPPAAESVLYQYSLSAFGGAPVPFASTAPRYQWSIATDASSDWLSIDPDTGLLSGTPPVGSLNTAATFIATVNDNLYPLPAGNSWNIASKQFSIGVVERLTILSQTIELARVGSTYRPILQLAGGTPPYTWSILSGTLPNGITFDPNEGQFIGVPLLNSNNVYDLLLMVADAGAQSATIQMQLVVAVAEATNALELTTQVLNPGVATETFAYEAWLDAKSGMPPYQWRVAATSVDQLPPGLTVDQFGRIAGTPLSGFARTYTIKFEVEDALAAMSTAVLDLVLESLVSEPTITTQMLQDGEVGFSYPPSSNPPANSNAPGLRVSGGAAPFVWTVVSGELPDGLTFSSVGLITGIPRAGSDAAGLYTLTLRVTDANNLMDETTLSFSIVPFSGSPLAVVAQVLPTSTEEQFYSFRVNATGGANPTGTATPYTFRKLSGDLPIGVELDAFGQMRGTPDAGAAGQYVFTVEASDPAGFTATSAMSVTVLPKPDTTGGATGPVAGGSLGGNGSGCATNPASSGSVWWLAAFAAIASLALLRRRRA